QMQDEFTTYQESVKKLSEETKKTGQILDEGAVCEICHKTKFADGVGHSCQFCLKKSCARCGGRMQGKPGPGKEKVQQLWACNLCKRKQELMAKTGAWYHGGMARPVALDVGDIASGSDTGSTKADTSPSNEKRAKMMDKQGHDGSQGSEKENMDRQRSISRAGSLQGKELKRQFSMSDAMNRGHDSGSASQQSAPSSAGGSQAGSGPASAADQDKARDQDRGRGKERGSAKHRFHSESRLTETDRRYGALDSQHPSERDRHKAQREGERAPPTSNKGGHLEDKKMTPHGNSRNEQDTDLKDRHRDPQHERRHEDRDQQDRRRDGKDRRKDGRGGEQQADRYRQSPVNGRREYSDKDSYRGSRERLNDLQQQQQGGFEQDIDGGRLDRRGGSRHHRDRTGKEQRRSPSRERDRDRFGPQDSQEDTQFSRHRILIEHASDNQADDVRDTSSKDAGDKKQHLDPSSAGGGRTRNNRKKMETMLRNDSLSSDPSDCVRPPPPKPHKHKRGKKQRQHSLSSSEDELQSSPECSSCEEEVDLESESVSEKGELDSGNGSQRSFRSSQSRPKQEWPTWYDSQHHSHKPTLYDTGRGTSLETESGSSEPQVKDSGNDTGLSSSSNQTLNTVDDVLSKRQIKVTNLQEHPVTWQLSADGSKWIGHMILKKTVLEGGEEKRDSIAILGRSEALGLKVIGGKVSETGKLGAFITKVKKGSIADTVGHLRPGDEVVEWNGRSLQGATFEEVYDIILESKQEPQVELIVHRNVKHGETPPSVQPSFTDHARDYGLKEAIPDNQRSRRTVVPEPQPRSRLRSRPLSPPITGKLQVKLWYDVQSYQLIVSIISAIDLPLTENGKFRNPYCKMYMLPDRSEKSKRRTKTVASTIDPTWNQTFIYCPVKESDMHERLLEITVWDYDRVGASEFLGEVLIDLTTANLNDEPYWYQLDHHDNASIPLPASSPRTKTSQDPYDVRKDHLSPPVSSRGLSDSDMSELDFDDSIGVVPVVARDELSTRQRHQSAADKLEVPDLGGAGQRSRSPSREGSAKNSRSRSRSPAHMHMMDASRSLSPPDMRQLGTSPRSFPPSSSRSLGGTPSSTPSPKKRQLPAIPLEAQKASRDRVTQDLEERARIMKMKMKLAQQGQGTPLMHPEGDSRSTRRRDRHGDLGDRGHDRSISHDRVERMRERALERNYERGRDTERAHHRSRRHKEFSPDMSDDVASDVSETSDMSEVSKVSTISVRSTQSERPRRKLSEFASKMESRTTIPQRRQQAVSKSSASDSQGFDQNDGSVSDSAVTTSVTEGRKRRPSIGHKMAALVGLNRRSSSASQLAGGGKKRSSFQRSEEIGPVDLRGGMSKQASKDSTDGSIGSISSDSSSV
ncbi:regulating synaptic membrane exocytosis protein 2 isoform X3, partial [Biomphalaria glabrata]